jgi:hypothetical protein
VPIKHRTEQIPIEQVRNGMSLAVENDKGQQVLFQVQDKGFEFKSPGPTFFFIKSEPLENGEPWVIKKPAGTMMTRVLRETYDDGT